MKVLVARGADVKTKDKNEWTPLHAAAARGVVEIINVNLCNFFLLARITTVGVDPPSRRRRY